MTITQPQSSGKVATSKRRVSLKRYLEMEADSAEKLEFHNGKITIMAGGTLIHNTLAQRAARLMDNFVDDKALDYLVSNSDTKIWVNDQRVVFPDAVVICQQPIYYQGRKDIITNPLLIVEVLSPSTEVHDRTDKFGLYRTLPSFQEYVLIHQDKIKATVFTRQDDTTWIMRDYDGPDAMPILHALHGCTLDFAKLYKGIELA